MFDHLQSLNKWTMPHFAPIVSRSPDIRIKDMLSVRRGIATGANDYFLIDQATIDRYEIPVLYLKPILPSPRFVHDVVIEANSDGTPVIRDLKYLLDCTASPDEVRRNHPGLWAYLEEGVAKGIAGRALCASREIWYFQEKRSPALFIASYMGRSSESRACPIRFFVNFSTALVTNVFLNLYPTPELNRALGGDRERVLDFLNMLTSIPGPCVMQAGRAYGGGLHKIEPKEMLEIQMPSVPAWMEGVFTRQLTLL